eukprot:6211286-Pleurochrysis_carterae.AAC.3
MEESSNAIFWFRRRTESSIHPYCCNCFENNRSDQPRQQEQKARRICQGRVHPSKQEATTTKARPGQKQNESPTKKSAANTKTQLKEREAKRNEEETTKEKKEKDGQRSEASERPEKGERRTQE